VARIRGDLPRGGQTDQARHAGRCFCPARFEQARQGLSCYKTVMQQDELVGRVWDGEEDARALSRQRVEVWSLQWGSRYAISNLGRVASGTRGSGASGPRPPAGAGYRTVGIYPTRGSRAKTWLAHKLVVWAFDGPSTDPQRQDVRHVANPDKGCNVLHNLSYGTRSENMLDVLRHRREGWEPTPAEREGTNWFKGYTGDDYLVKVGLVFQAEGKLTTADLTRLWRCSGEVAGNIVRGETRKHVDRPVPARTQAKRTPARRDAIRALVVAGKNAAEINDLLGESLTPQAVYYYKSGVRKELGQPDSV